MGSGIGTTGGRRDRIARAHGGGDDRRFGQRKTMRQLEPERHGRGRSFHGSSRTLGRARQKAPHKNPLGVSPAGPPTYRPPRAPVPRPLGTRLPPGFARHAGGTGPARAQVISAPRPSAP